MGMRISITSDTTTETVSVVLFLSYTISFHFQQIIFLFSLPSWLRERESRIFTEGADSQPENTRNQQQAAYQQLLPRNYPMHAVIQLLIQFFIDT